MATLKHKTEGGSGGKLGHSNMSHRDETEIIKEATKIRRRNNAKKQVKQEIEHFFEESDVEPKRHYSGELNE